MATGRIGVTPTLRTRWSKQPTAGTTSLSGLDDNSVSLVYDVGYEAVYRNGTLLSRGNDYTATNGTTVTLIDATLAGDIIEILANQLVPLSDAISKGQYNAKGALLSATAASTPGVLAVGTNGQYLSADSTASTGLAWATVSSGRTLLSTTTLSGATTTVSGISQAYKELYIEIANVNPGTNSNLRIAPNSVTNLGYTVAMSGGGVTVHESGYWKINQVWNMTNANTNNITTMYIHNYTSSTEFKTAESNCLFQALSQTGLRIIYSAHGFESTTAISSLQFSQDSGNQNGGTVRIYGVN